MSASDVLKLMKDKEVEYVDLRFTDPRGKLQHLTMDSTIVDEGMLNDGVFFDGSPNNIDALSNSVLILDSSISGNEAPFIGGTTMNGADVMCESSDMNSNYADEYGSVYLTPDAEFESLYCNFGEDGAADDNFPSDVSGGINWEEDYSEDFGDVASFACDVTGCVSFDSIPEECGSGLDEDEDGLIDCYDDDCFGSDYCSSFETCDNGFDDDENGFADCFEGDCLSGVIDGISEATADMIDASVDWVDPSQDCYEDGLSLYAPDLAFGHNATTSDGADFEGCIRYFTSTEQDTVLSLLDTCPSLGGTTQQCNDDIDIDNQDYQSELYVDVTADLAPLIVVSSYEYSVDSDANTEVTLSTEVQQMCYTLEMVDSYGDSWNGGYLTITQDGVSTVYENEDLDGQVGSTSEESQSENICLNASSFSVEWTGGGWVYEVSFSLIGDNGEVVCEEADPEDGVVCGGAIVPTCEQVLSQEQIHFLNGLKPP